jgi:hypothetical protein
MVSKFFKWKVKYDTAPLLRELKENLSSFKMFLRLSDGNFSVFAEFGET